MANKTTVRPGELSPKSGQYEVIGPRGRQLGVEVTATKGNPMPPTAKPGMSFRLVDPTKHKGA